MLMAIQKPSQEVKHSGDRMLDLAGPLGQEIKRGLDADWRSRWQSQEIWEPKLSGSTSSNEYDMPCPDKFSMRPEVGVVREERHRSAGLTRGGGEHRLENVV